MRIDTLEETDGEEGREIGTETEALPDAMRDEMKKRGHQGETETCLRKEEVVVDDGVIEATAKDLGVVQIVETEKRVHLLHPRRRSQHQI